ncbi:MAG: aldo/keto reductase [Planctomycetaceae bacterium]|jgi:aryl-alcohol dehydrogenase-like predicted oxidoreductase|nr:aldo/keto reductase [Planctomycetaceae bacterium]MBT7988937.1 aldo/keto reductase [Anaerolineae bacterium]
MTFEKRKLGNTDIEVSPIGLGVMQFAGGEGVFGKIFPVLAQEEKNTIIQTALDNGINWFDTAEMYGFGRSEQGLSDGLKAAGKGSEDVVVATKWLPLFRSARNIPKTIHDRIRFLDGYNIDLYMVHQPWSFSSTEAQMDAMADLVEAGYIRSVGISNFNAGQMRRAYTALQKRGVQLAANQMEYSLLNRKIESNNVIATAKELGVTITAYTPLGYGLLTGKYHKNPELFDQSSRSFMLKRKFEQSRPIVEALEEIAKKYDATPGQVALNWVIHFQGETVVTIPGATKVEHVKQSAGTMKFKLSKNELMRLDELSSEFL